MAETRSTCPYCGVGCGVIIESQGDRITGVRGDPDHPANFGRLCTKGSTLHLTASETVTRQARLLQPMQRLQRGAAPQPIEWDAATVLAAERLAGIIERHGPDAVGFYLSGQLLTEDYHVFNKLARGLVGTNQIDSNSRLCMSSAVVGYKRTLGSDAPPACYDDLGQTDCLFISGSNTAWAHPILFRRIEEARAGMRIIVVDPRRTETAAMADLHLQIEPGTDVLLCHGLLHIMLWEGWTRPDFIARHTSGFEALKDLVRQATPEHVARGCGVSVTDLHTAARWFAQSAATLSLYCMGLNQSSSGSAKNAALINLHLATGQIGKPGAGPFSLTGQPNAMGGREVGAMATLLPGHRDPANAQHRAEIARLWGLEELPASPGLTATEMFEAAAEGQIKALWIACTNPAQSMPDQALVRRALERAEFVIVQEAFATAASCDYADLLLPAASWGEKEGSVTNSERRISRVRAAIVPPGQARPDWLIARDIGRRLEARLRRGQPSLFGFETPEQAWLEHRASTRGRDLDITGLSYALLDQIGPQQWPMPEGASQGQARLYSYGMFATPDGRARFAADAWRPVAEPRSPRYPFSLSTGRLRDQWHGMTRTGTLGRLFGHAPEPAVDLHPDDLAALGLQAGELVRVSNARGAIVLPVQACAELGRQQAFIPMHWGSEALSGQDAAGQALAGVNALTTSASCPLSKQPELKHCAVRIDRADLPWTLFGMAWLPEPVAIAVQRELRQLMTGFDFASCVPFGRERCGVLLRAACAEAPPVELVRRVEALLGLTDIEVLRYEDRSRGHSRSIRQRRCGDETLLEALLLAGDSRAETWLRTLLQDELPTQAFGSLLLKPGAQAPVALAARSPQVCTCLDVREDAIRQALPDCAGSDPQRLEQLQGRLGCGTRCGSCVPALKRLIAFVPARAALSAER
jgi:assimilatory nitrate reductase catalytic subunit